MLRAMSIALAAVAAITLGSVFSAPAMARGGFGGGGGHMGGGVHMGGFGHAAFAHPGGFGHFGAARPFGFPGHHVMFPGRHFAFHNRFAFRHRFFRHRFAFIGLGVPLAYDDCYRRVWTEWGWRWVNVCY